MEDQFLAKIVRNGWKLEEASAFNDVNGAPLHAIPDDLRKFLASYGTLTNARETTWLNSAQDFASKSTGGFSWNEFELISLAAAEGNDTWRQEVQAFWSSHLPILMSVEGHYEYVAYCSAGNNDGLYVQGSEPEFEHVKVVAASLAGFKSWLLSNAA